MVQSSINLEQFADGPAAKSHGGCGTCGTGQALAGVTRCGNGLEKIYPSTAVRFGYMRYIGEFSHAPDMKFTCGAKVVIQTHRGIEIGEQVSLTCHGCEKSVTREQMKAWVATCGEDSFTFDAGRILREAASVDLAEYARMQQGCKEKRRFCQEVANRYRLPMRVAECECPFGGERIIFFFTSAERIDFRAMVKDLAREYRTRIEMHQVGARDEARLLADYETCGREVCCKVFLKTLRPISMRMAKVQKATLDPTQVSGRCGRLKCCLRYEHVGYEELDKKLPRVGVRIATHHGEGVVVNRQILTQLVQFRTEDDKLITVVAEDITEVDVKPHVARTVEERLPVRGVGVSPPDLPGGHMPPSTGTAGADSGGAEASDARSTPAPREGNQPRGGRPRRRRGMRRRRPDAPRNTGGNQGPENPAS